MHLEIVRTKRITNCHHTIPKSRIRRWPDKGKRIKVKVKRRIPIPVHDNFHFLFQNSYIWEVIKKLKQWRKQLKPPLNARQRQKRKYPFYLRFTNRQHIAFYELFGFFPEQLDHKGNFKQAMEVLSAHFTVPEEPFEAFVRWVKSHQAS